MSRRLMVLVLVGGVAAGIIGERGLALAGAQPFEMVLDIVCYATFLIGGVVVWALQPGDRTGRIMVAIAYAGYLAGMHGYGIPLLFTLAWCFGITDFVLRQCVLLAYPGGRLTNRSLRWLVAMVYLVLLANVLFFTSTQWEGGVRFFSISQQAYQLSSGFNATLSIVFVLAGSVILVVRWFRGSPAYRQVMGPVLLLGAIPGDVLFVMTDYVGEAALEAMLPGFYLANIFMAVALVFGMLRTRLAGTVGGLMVDVSHPLPVGGLRDALARSLHDPSLEIVFHAAGTGWVDASGARVELPTARPGRAVTILEGEREPIAALIHDDVWLREPEVVEANAAAARLALENERLHAELRAQLAEVRASRARIIEAADVERRRLERDLHDGAQQRLVTVALSIREAQSRMNGVDPQLTATLEETVAELRRALSELRELARGIHPAILTEEGLAAALESLAERSSVLVNLTARSTARAPAPVEAAAYFVASEALANVAKHARATRADVLMDVRQDRLVVQIADDGIGGADPMNGSGLLGLEDRVAALDGKLEVRSPSGGGTTVVAEFPCGSS